MTRVKSPPFRSALGALAASLAIACGGGDGPAGVWDVATVDGIGPAVAAPLRVPVPEGTYDTLVMKPDWSWKEYTVDSLTLDLREDGTFTERRIEATSMRVTHNSYVRPEYVTGAFGGDLIRDAVKPTAHEVSGSWKLAGDTVTLELARDAAIADATADVADLLGPIDGIRGNVEAALPDRPPPRWSGEWKDDRLELTNPEGRSLTFRKRGAPR